MANRDIVVIGASAGGIEALKELMKGIPAGFNAAIFVVLHTSSHGGSLLPLIFQRASNLPVTHPSDGTPIEKGRIYIAPPDFHMIVENGVIRVLQGPRENLHRPAIDPLFRSAAVSYGRRVIGIVLTGLLDDGTSGLMVVRARGGVAIVQDPATALFSSMPASALEQVPDAHVLALGNIPDLLARLVGEELPEAPPAVPMNKERASVEIRIAEMDMSEIENEERPGQPSVFACPDCGGVLWENEDNSFLRYRCRVGHAFTARNLGSEQRQAIETALWSALRALEENASLYRRLAERAASSSHSEMSRQFLERAENVGTNAKTLRDFLMGMDLREGEESFSAEGA